MKTMHLGALGAFLTNFVDDLPTVWRKRFYKTAKIVSGLATLVILLLPVLSDLGIEAPSPDRLTALATGALYFLGLLADRHTVQDAPVESQEDYGDLDV